MYGQMTADSCFSYGMVPVPPQRETQDSSKYNVLMRQPCPQGYGGSDNTMGSEFIVYRIQLKERRIKKEELIFEKHNIAFVNPFDNPDADILAGIGLADRHVFAFH